jgi:hypothetical protein
VPRIFIDYNTKKIKDLLSLAGDSPTLRHDLS